MSIKLLTVALGGALCSLALPGCDLDIPDLNNPGLEQLENNPTRISITTATTGLLVGNRAAKSTTAGYVNQLGILGRESYDIDASESRFVTELLQGALVKNSPFGGVFWANNYSNIRLGNIVLHGVDKVLDLSDAEKNGIRGFTHTIQALELLVVIVTHDSTGAVIDTDHPLGEPLGPFVSKAEVYAEILRLLDLAATELAGAGTGDKAAFAFALSPGFDGFNKPETFLTFNRAVKARVEVYLGSGRPGDSHYQDALTALAASFITEDPAKAGFKAGVSYAFTLTSGDVQNGLINKAIYAHPKLQTEADKQMDGTTPDARYVSKIDDTTVTTPVTSPSDSALSSKLKFKMYAKNTDSIPLIRNEELLLLKAEALYFTGNKAGGLAELNLVRTNVGKLLPVAAVADDAAFITALLYERRYSLMYEGGHRWIDLRRFGRELPLDAPTHKRNLHYPVPQAECDARPGEPACSIASTDP